MQNQEGIQVFLSYAHDDQPTIVSIAKRLEEETGISVEYDTTIGPRKKVHPEISRMINRADIVVVSITKKFLKRFECLDELIRAHDRGKPILAFVEADDKLKLPYFISDDRQIRYKGREFEQKLDELAKAIHDYSPDIWMQQILKALRSLGDSVYKSEDTYIHQQNYLVELVRNTEEELKNMLKNIDFKIELGLEKNFLTRATPIFHTSDETYAVSIADVSNFWINPNTVGMAKKYIEGQRGKKVIRLFVFASPNQLNKFRNVVQANYDAYGKDQGGVFITSMDTYYSFMTKEELPFIKNPGKEDFGVLVFNNERAKRREHLLAILNAAFLEFRYFGPKAPSSAPMMQFVGKMNSLLDIREGQFGTPFNILRWSDKYSVDPSAYGEILEKLFSRQEQEVLHLVFVKAKGNKTIEDIMLNVQNEFSKHRDEFGMTEICVHKIINVSAHDGIYGGLLKVGDGGYDYLFVMKFHNSDALKGYYAHTLHSKYREILYEAIKPAVKQKFQQAYEMIQKKGRPCQEAADIFHGIEEMMSPSYIFRYDTTRHDPISNILKQPGLPIGKYKW